MEENNNYNRLPIKKIKQTQKNLCKQGVAEWNIWRAERKNNQPQRLYGVKLFFKHEEEILSRTTKSEKNILPTCVLYINLLKEAS